MVKVNIEKARDARHADGSILEYGLTWQLEKFNDAINKGVPSDDRFVDEYMKNLEKSNGLLVLWLEDFKSKFGGNIEALPTIEGVELALQKYREFYAQVRLPIEIKNARNARKADGSILEYGLDLQLERFSNSVFSFNYAC